MPSFQNNLHLGDNFVAILDGEQCTVLAHFYEAIGKSLQFPDYFRHNFDSLDECLCDLSWIREDRICLLILHFEDLLYEEKYHLEVVQNILANALVEQEARGRQLLIYTQETSG